MDTDLPPVGASDNQVGSERKALAGGPKRAATAHPVAGSGKFPYDICVSFASEDRDYVEKVVERLVEAQVKVFYDRLEQVELWGKDLYAYLDDVYQHRAQYCVMFVSRAYATKRWTNHERSSAQARALGTAHEYILPARFDDTAVPGLRDTIGYVPLAATPPDVLAGLILAKLGRSAHDYFVPPVPDRLMEALALSGPAAETLARRHAQLFVDTLKKMTLDEKNLLMHVFVLGCPTELPDNLHVSMNMLSRSTGMRTAKIKRLLGGLAPLGYSARIRQQEHEDSGELGHDEYLVIEYGNLNVLDDEDDWIENLGVATDTEFLAAIVDVLTDDFCPAHAVEYLARGDLSQLSSATARRREAHSERT
jgi:TIR domain